MQLGSRTAGLSQVHPNVGSTLRKRERERDQRSMQPGGNALLPVPLVASATTDWPQQQH